ncbi:aminoglycoside phosphotransferase family protein [Methanosarcina sp. T3]|uniref:aminoglycoside phosphotransferase family protein n=1 Tax=Methanosarcina sp. T3 TaxID=3439062 RepID=UPI003F831136
MKPGDSFRDWLVRVQGHRIKNPMCNVREFRVRPASHKVCRYEFEGEGFSVIAKFFGKPTGKIKKYDCKGAMLNEYHKLKRLEKTIDIPCPIAANRHFDCVLVTEYIPGKPFSWYLKNEKDLDEKLKVIAYLLGKLHRDTKSNYEKKRDFTKIRSTLSHMPLHGSTRQRYEKKLERWENDSRLDRTSGCTIHRDATPANYLFYRGKIYALDLELSTGHGYFVHDLGILSAEIFHHFARKGTASAAFPHIKSFLRNYSLDKEEYRQIKQVLPLYMSYGLLRVAWRSKDPKHRKYLINKAFELLDRPTL